MAAVRSATIVTARKVATKKAAAPKKALAKKTTPAKTKASETASDTPDPPIKPAPKARSKPAKVSYDLVKSGPKKISATERADRPPPATGSDLIERVSWAIERELNQIELIVGGHHLKPAQRTEAERRARTLASLARTLAVVTQLRAKQSQGHADDADDDSMPRDLDDFRDALARRLERLLADRAQPADREPHSG